MKNFTQIPNNLLRNPKIKNGPFRLLVYLISYKYGKNSVFVSHKRMAKELGVEERTIINNLNSLKKSGFIDWEKRGFGKSNAYTFNLEKFFTIETKDEKIFTPKVKIDSKSYGNKFHPNNKENNKISNNRGIEGIRELVNSWKPNIKQTLDNSGI